MCNGKSNVIEMDVRPVFSTVASDIVGIRQWSSWLWYHFHPFTQLCSLDFETELVSFGSHMNLFQWHWQYDTVYFLHPLPLPSVKYYILKKKKKKPSWTNRYILSDNNRITAVKCKSCMNQYLHGLTGFHMLKNTIAFYTSIRYCV